MPGSPMFWRIVRRLLTANYGRVFVILLALSAGAAVTAALLNLQIDAKRRLTTEFRATGRKRNRRAAAIHRRKCQRFHNRRSHASPDSFENDARLVPAVGFLYVIGEVAKGGTLHYEPAVIAGTSGRGLTEIRPGRRNEYNEALENNSAACEIGTKAAAQFHVHAGDSLQIRNQGREAACKIFAVVATGGAEDTQIFTSLATAQSLAALPGRLSLIQLSVTGAPDSVNRFIANLGQRLPSADVHGVKQFAEAEGRIYNRISGLLSSTVILVLFLTSLCVMAGMSNVAIERKNDVGLMKAIGGSVRRVVRLFLAEAIILGVAGGLVGSALGLLVSIWLGKAVFGVAAEPRWIVYPFSVALTILVSVASAFPLRRLASVRPASVFRGEA